MPWCWGVETDSYRKPRRHTFTIDWCPRWVVMLEWLLHHTVGSRIFTWRWLQRRTWRALDVRLDDALAEEIRRQIRQGPPR